MTRSLRAWAHTTCAAFGAWLSTHPVSAQPSDGHRADVLFQEARVLMHSNRYAEACPKLEESQRLDPAPGTELNLADCWEHIGRTASAFREFRALAESAEKTGESERARIAHERATALERRLTTLRLWVPAERRVPGLEVFENSQPIVPEQWGTAIAVDPGVIVIEARAPQRQGVRSEVNVAADGAIHDLILQPLAPATPESRPLPSVDDDSARRDGLRNGGIGVTAAGGVSLALGAFFGIRAGTLYHRSRDQGCDSDNACSPSALDTRHSAIHAGNAATALFVVGGVLVAGGIGLYFAGARPARPATAARVVALPGAGALAVVDTTF